MKTTRQLIVYFNLKDILKFTRIPKCLVCCASFLCPYILQAAIIYVNPSAAGANNGNSWADGFTSLSSALISAKSGDEIWVKKGVYKPSIKVDFNSNGSLDNQEATFQVPNGVAVYGGFLGTEGGREERNITSNLTILSGDIDNNDFNGDANSVAENPGHVIGNNAYHVIFTWNVTTSTRVDGFIITAGKALSPDTITDVNQDGGGWYNRLSKPVNASSPTVVNTTFIGNYAASRGGAMYFTNAEKEGEVLSLIQNCKFIGNQSNDDAGAIYFYQSFKGNHKLQIKTCMFTGNEAFAAGGAMFLSGDHTKIDSSIFENNKATAISNDNTLAAYGGAAHLYGSNALFSNCIFKGNSATGNPTGPMEDGGGGALSIKTDESRTTAHGVSAPKIISCGFYGNVAEGNTTSWGGAVKHLNDGGKLSLTYVNCIFSGNKAQDDGGAMANYSRVLYVPSEEYIPLFSLNITNCTFVKNHAIKKGGAIFTQGYVWKEKEVSNSRIENTIIWDNVATKANPEVYFEGTNLIAGSLIKGSGGSGGAWKPAFGTDGGSNIDANPGFININDADGPDNIPANSDDGLKLKAGASPVNKGNNAAAGLTGITKDFQSLARINGGKVDIGAYERGGFIPGGANSKLSNWKPASICLSCTWAFIFNDKKFEHFVWDGPAQLIEKEGSATITGRIVNAADRRMGFDVLLELINKTNWQGWSRQGGIYTAISPEAVDAAKRNHVMWSFWDLSEKSYLRGTGELGGQLRIQRLPAGNKSGFQMGNGANGWDADLGLSGSFVYEGLLSYQGARTAFNGAGSMNVDATPCLDACALTAQKVEVTSSNDLNKLSFALIPESSELSVFPIPAHSRFQIMNRSLQAGTYTLKIYNWVGQLKRHENITLTNGTATIPVNNLAAGHYVLQLVSQSGEISTKKIIIN